MPDSISQSTATVLRINGREMSYCAIFVRDLCARPSPRVLRSSSAKRVSFIPSLARGRGYRRDVSGERSPANVYPSVSFYSFFFARSNGDYIGIAFFRSMLIDFFGR